MTKALTITAIAISFVFSLLLLSFAQESVTITTYYPSPYGVYRELRSTRMAIGDNYIRGGDYDWGDEINNNADLVVEGNVGIGTPAPGVELHVRSIGAVPNGDIAIQPATPRLWTMSVSPEGVWELHYLLASSSYNGVNDYIPVRVHAEGGWATKYSCCKRRQCRHRGGSPNSKT